jgi:hypothetical protein
MVVEIVPDHLQTCLANGILITRGVLPHHCYTPFNLRNKTHPKYLSRVFETGKIELFRAGNLEREDK